MKITFEPTTKKDYTACSISTANDDMTLTDMMESLVIPALLGIGFEKKSIDDYFNNEE